MDIVRLAQLLAHRGVQYAQSQLGDSCPASETWPGWGETPVEVRGAQPPTFSPPENPQPMTDDSSWARLPIQRACQARPRPPPAQREPGRHGRSLGELHTCLNVTPLSESQSRTWTPGGLRTLLGRGGPYPKSDQPKLYFSSCVRRIQTILCRATARQLGHRPERARRGSPRDWAGVSLHGSAQPLEATFSTAPRALKGQPPCPWTGLTPIASSSGMLWEQGHHCRALG